MRTVKAFKVKIKTNFWRQLVFSDWILTVSLSIGTALLIFFRTSLPNEAKITLIIMLATVYMIIGLGKIENQPIYKVVYKALIYLFYNPKKLQAHTKYKDMFSNSKLTKPLIDFHIVDSLVVFSDRLVSVLQINPLDYSLMKQADQDRLYYKLKDLLHSYKEDNLQLITRTREARPEDYQDYLNHLVTMPIYSPNKEVAQIRSRALESFLENFTQRLNQVTFPVQQHYLVVSHYCKTSDAKNLLDSTVILQEKSLHASKLLIEAGFKVQVLSDFENKTDLSQAIASIIRQLFF